VSGRLSAPFEEDRYRIPVTPGSKLRFEVFAERCGSPVDAAILVRNEAGDLLARGEDGPETLDPSLDFAVPANVNAILACVTDTQGRGDTNCTYRLAIELPDSLRPDFRLSTITRQTSLPVGGRAVIPIVAEPAAILAPSPDPGLAAGWLAAGGYSDSAGTDGTLVTVLRDEDSFDSAITGWRGIARRPVTGRCEGTFDQIATVAGDGIGNRARRRAR
jgi:hypothetical protein